MVVAPPCTALTVGAKCFMIVNNNIQSDVVFHVFFVLLFFLFGEFIGKRQGERQKIYTLSFIAYRGEMKGNVRLFFFLG